MVVQVDRVRARLVRNSCRPSDGETLHLRRQILALLAFLSPRIVYLQRKRLLIE
jgi:hypothetical protein